MQITFFSFIMSLLWFNLYILIINSLRKNDSFIISFTTLPLVFFLSLSILRLIFNFEIPGSIVIASKRVYTGVYDFIIMPLNLRYLNINVYQLIILIWIIGIIILLTNTIKRYILFKRNLGKLKKQQTEQTAQVLNKILNKSGMSKKIEIIQNKEISSPFIIGILRGKIYLPDINFSEEEFEYIISHEINHFLSNDFLKKVLIQVIKYLFWWNPLVYLFANDFNQILEIQCDLKTTLYFSEEEKIRYLESITKIIKKCIKTNIEGVKFTVATNFLELEEFDSLKQRFRIVLNYRPKRNIFKTFNAILYILSLFLFISSYFIIIQPHYVQVDNGIYTKENEKTSFIIEKLSGSYDVYINNTFKYNIERLEDLNKTLGDLPIYKEDIN